MTETSITITKEQIELFKNMQTELENRIIQLSVIHGITDKFTTGFGWFQNVISLQEHGVISPQTKKDIDDVKEGLSSFCRRHQVSLEELEIVNSEWDRLMNGLQIQLNNTPH